MEKEKQVVGDNRNNDFQGFVLDDSPKTVEEQLEIIKKYLERSMPRLEYKTRNNKIKLPYSYRCDKREFNP